MSKDQKRLNIGFFTCHLDNDYAYEVCKGVDCAAKELDVNLFVFPGMYMNASFSDPGNQRFDYQYNAIYYYASKRNLDAIIVAVGSIGSFLSVPDVKRFLDHFDLPIITIEYEVPGYPYIYTEGVTGMREAIEHLINEHNARKIGFVSGRLENADAVERLETYKSVLRDHDIFYDAGRVVYGDFSQYSDEIVGDLLDRNPDLDAIVFANDSMAVGGYRAIAARGLEIGSDILVTGYDDSPVSLVLEPQLTTVHNQIMDMGYHAVRQAVRLAGGQDTDLSTLNSNLVIRSSCGCGEQRLAKFAEAIPEFSVESDYEKTLSSILDFLLKDHQSSFYYEDLRSNFSYLIEPILSSVIQMDSYDFDIQNIKAILSNMLETSLFKMYFNIDMLSYIISELNQLLQRLAPTEEGKNAIGACFSEILYALMLHISSTLYKKEYSYKKSIWNAMYITRDALTYSDNEETCYRLIMQKLQDSKFTSACLYLYDEPIMLMADGTWKVPQTLFLQASNTNGEIRYFRDDARVISSEDVLTNPYTPAEERRTSVVAPIFSNNIQYGLFVGDIDIEYFSNIYPNSLQLAASLSSITLATRQVRAEKRLAAAAEDLNLKNERLANLTLVDPLTGLFNRRGFLDTAKARIEQPENTGRDVVLLSADMNNLKQVNDIYGQEEGDYALTTIARVLTSALPEGTVIGRVDGDEFLAFIMLPKNSRPEELKEAVLAEFDSLNDNSEKPYFIQASLGTIPFVCNPDESLEEIMQSADIALYENKKNKRQSVIKPKS